MVASKLPRTGELQGQRELAGKIHTLYTFASHFQLPLVIDSSSSFSSSSSHPLSSLSLSLISS